MRAAAADSATRSPARPAAFRALVVLFALAALVPGFGIADLTTPINPRWNEGDVAEVGYGALAGILLPVGFLYGIEAAANQRDGVPPLALDSHGPLNSWAALAAAAFAVALVAPLASLGTGLSGAFYCSREAMRVMREHDGSGVILITASPHAFLTGKEIAAYAASKGGLVALMRALALEGVPKIRANAILPGAISTPMIERELAHAPDPEAQLRTFAQAQALARLGEPEEIAKVAVFLVSDAAAFVTGACLAADGGLMAALNSGPGISYAT